MRWKSYIEIKANGYEQRIGRWKIGKTLKKFGKRKFYSNNEGNRGNKKENERNRKNAVIGNF